jgi:putative transcription factor
MSESGWTTVTYKKKKNPKSEEIINSQPTQTAHKREESTTIKSTNKSTVNSKKVEQSAEDGIYIIQKVSNALKLQLQQARQNKGWTQRQLAQQCNLQENVIRNYESGTCIPNQQEINKMSKALGVSLKNK